MEDSVKGGQAEGSELVPILNEILRERVAGLTSEHPSSARAAQSLIEAFGESSNPLHSLDYVEYHLLKATFQLYLDQPGLSSVVTTIKGPKSGGKGVYHFSKGGDDDASDGESDSSSGGESNYSSGGESSYSADHYAASDNGGTHSTHSDDSNEGSGSQEKPSIRPLPERDKEKPIFVEAIYKEVWKAFCGEDSKSQKGREKLKATVNVSIGSIGTKLATTYGTTSVAMIALVAAVTTYAAKITFDAYCAMMSSRYLNK